MPISTHRLLDAIDQLVASTKENVPGVYESVAVLLAELRQRDRLDLMRERYSLGRRLLGRQLELQTNVAAELAAIRGDLGSLPVQLEHGRDWTHYEAKTEQLMALMARFCTLKAFPNAEDRAFDAAVSALLQWESTVSDALRTPTVQPGRPDVTAASLQSAVRQQGGRYRDIRITNEKVLGGGLSKTMVLFDAEGTQIGPEKLVARIESDLPVLEDVYLGMHIPFEYHLIRYAWRHGVPVAEPRLLADNRNDLSRHFFVSACVPGTIKADFRLAMASLSAPISDAVAAALAAIHRMPVDVDDADLKATHIAIAPPRTRRDANVAFIDALERDWRNSGEPASPLIETALLWLRANAPGADDAACIVHGDCGLNNIMFSGDRITGVLDWEAAHIGDPAEDVCWFLFTLLGVADPGAFIDAYVAAGGKRPDEFTLHYMAVLARMKLLFVRDSVRPRYERFNHARPALAVAGHVYGHRTMTDLAETLRQAEAVRRRCEPAAGGIRD